MWGSEVIRRCQCGERGEGGALTQRIRLPWEVLWNGCLTPDVEAILLNYMLSLVPRYSHCCLSDSGKWLRVAKGGEAS